MGGVFIFIEYLTNLRGRLGSEDVGAFVQSGAAVLVLAALVTSLLARYYYCLRLACVRRCWIFRTYYQLHLLLELRLDYAAFVRTGSA